MADARSHHLLGFIAILVGCGGSGRDGRGGDGDGDADADRALDAGPAGDAAVGGCDGCCWHDGDPGDLVATGAEEGDTIANVSLIDQCGAPVSLWGFAGQYRVLWITTAW